MCFNQFQPIVRLSVVWIISALEVPKSNYNFEFSNATMYDHLARINRLNTGWAK